MSADSERNLMGSDPGRRNPGSGKSCCRLRSSTLRMAEILEICIVIIQRSCNFWDFIMLSGSFKNLNLPEFQI